MHLYDNIEDYFIDDPNTSSPNLSEIPVQPFVIQNNFSFQQQEQQQPLPLHLQLLQEIRMNNPRNPQKKHLYEKYTRLRAQEPRKNFLNKEDPYIKIKVIKNLNGFNINIPNEHIINEFGMIDSLKNTDQEDIMIGRQDKMEGDNGEAIYPNDIVLREQDRLISRIHCKINTKNFFSKEIIIKPLYKNTLKYLGLPINICSRIQKFLEEPKDCFVQDLGSVYGTHIRVNKHEPLKIIRGQQFSVGTDTTFQAVDIHVSSKNLKPIDEEFEKTINKIRNIHLKCQIHGLQIPISPGTEKFPLNDLLSGLKVYNVPFLLLKFGGSGIPGNHFNLFFAQNPNQVFSIGRGSDNNMRINSNTISRKQTRFQFVNNQWQIADGCPEKESANGTWLQLATIRERDLRLESQWYQLKHLSEIKISDYILKIELFRPRKQQKVDKQMIKSLL